MPNSTILIALLVLAVIVAFVVPMAKKTKENFASSGIDTYDSLVGSRDPFIEMSKQKYNKFSDPMDVTRGTFARSDDPAVLKRVSEEINAAMATSELAALPGEPTLIGPMREKVTAQLPPPNGVLSAAKKCESLKTRGSCAKLDDPAFKNCGICIKGGSPYSEENPGKHIGGLLVLPEDRAFAEETAKEQGVKPTYEATVGSCPPGYLFVNRAACEREANRADCKEVGESGGFTNGKTDEGLKVGLAKCAQIPAAGESTYIYEPKGDKARKFKVNLRVLAPVGTGITKVFVLNKANQQVANGIGYNPGLDFIVNIPMTSELTEYTVVVEQEVPHRKRGKQEVFHLWRNLNGSGPAGFYNMTKDTAKAACESIGARLATGAELEESFQKGNQICSCAQTTDYVGYPMQNGYEKRGWCGAANAINRCGSEPNSWNRGMGNAWCYGVKPPSTNGNGGMTMFNAVANFFNPVGNTEPSQNDMPGQWSEYGDYQAPYNRAVLLQWEVADGSGTRVIPFEPTIVGINGMGPSTVSSDGYKTFKILRRMGTFSKSTLIMAPRPSGLSQMISNQFWIWSNQANSQTVRFSTKVPGIFLQPFYPEDGAIASRGPLVGNPATMDLLKTSPCLKDGQKAGKYSIDCLSNLFVGAGGDIYRGKLAKENGGLAQLNAMKDADGNLADMDAISEYLNNLYTLATTGRDASGQRVGGENAKARAQAINNAAQLLFGFDITTPCEDISEDSAGNIVISPKKGAVDADCLDYLWMNTNSDRDRGDEDRSRNTTIKNTYTTIGARFSGLRSSESIAATREKFPFQTCQRTGKMAPIAPNGQINTVAMNLANSKGSIQAIQNFYDDIHKAANNLGGNQKTMDQHEQAMEQCYGIAKNVGGDAGTGCGVKARYVRVLASGVHGINPGNTCIQIPQIEIFDANGKEVAKGKKATASSVWPDGQSGPEKAVDGKNYLHGHGSEFHDACTGPDNQYWMVDLGKMYEVARVKFYPRTDCCNWRQLGAPIQLLDESYNVVAEKNLGETNFPYAWGQVEELLFAARDAKPEVDLKIGAKFSLTTALAWDRYLRHAGFAIWAHPPDSGPGKYSNLMKNDGTFKIIPALNGMQDYVSFQSVNYSNYYLRHSGFRCWLHSHDGGDEFKRTASWKIVPALNGNPSMVSFQVVQIPQYNGTYYLATHRNAPDQVHITTIEKTNAFDTQRACWKIRRPLTSM